MFTKLCCNVDDALVDQRLLDAEGELASQKGGDRLNVDIGATRESLESSGKIVVTATQAENFKAVDWSFVEGLEFGTTAMDGADVAVGENPSSAHLPVASPSIKYQNRVATNKRRGNKRDVGLPRLDEKETTTSEGSEGRQASQDADDTGYADLHHEGDDEEEEYDDDIPPGDLGSSGDSDDMMGMSESDEEMRNFFPATRPGFKEVAGKVARVTRADFDDDNRRRHLECFARSMESWKNFEVRHKNEQAQFSLSALHFDRYRDIFVDIDVNTLSSLDQFIYHLLTSSEDVSDQATLNSLMAKLRRKFHIAPSKRDIFERLLELQRQADMRANNGEKVDEVGATVAVKPAGEDEHDAERSKSVKYDSKMQHLLRIKGTRSNSGVVVITVLTAPGNFSCPNDCHYCPNEPGQPRSYLSTEPAVLRANQNSFDPVKQFYDRAMTLYRNGHVIDKIEILVLGGTWSGYPRKYQEDFCRDLYYAANIFPGPIETARPPKSIEEEQDLNEKGECRIIGLTLETRPDRITPREIKNLRKFGCTRVQLGIQHVNDEVLEYVNRGHTVADTMKALYLLKENCYKVDIHIMPDLPSSNPDMDLEMFAKILSDEGLQADQWKIYPCEVAPFSKIEEWHREGKYVPYFDTDPSLMTNLLMRVKRSVHPWIRINRLVRDIPNPSIIAGTNVTNMRQLLMTYMMKRSIACHCIRCREVKAGNVSLEAKLMVRQYETTGGTEFFLSYETQDESKIFGFLRLRLSNSRKFDPKKSLYRCLVNCAFIRELHVYGVVVAHGKSVNEKTPWQHRGIGASLLLASEIIAAAKGFSKMAVIAGIGTREYYAKHGYEIEDTFMTKYLSPKSIRERYRNQKTQGSIRVPHVIKINVIDLNDAVETLRLPLPEAHQGKNPPPPVFEETFGEYYCINVKRFLRFARANRRNFKDYTREKILIIDELLGKVDTALEYLEEHIRFLQDRPVFVASVAFFSIVFMMKLRNRTV
ncbi:histone acetyltransferase-related protein [Babesia gibsoni]|uniref:tRNA carboxymethyluridine synthase n=1 Tax=Babesia gibsoni TaxID=33632 RepID=A0AAD8PEJ3_BABGI|nr:histone acetyltransferase-related protein [Babesia gibsoni]